MCLMVMRDVTRKEGKRPSFLYTDHSLFLTHRCLVCLSTSGKTALAHVAWEDSVERGRPSLAMSLAIHVPHQSSKVLPRHGWVM